MEKNVSIGEALTLLFVCIYNFAIIYATGYEVFEKGHSGWWFLFSFLLIFIVKSDDKKKECKCQTK